MKASPIHGVGVFTRRPFKKDEPLILEANAITYQINDGYTSIPDQVPPGKDAEDQYQNILQFARLYNEPTARTRRVNIYMASYGPGKVNMFHAVRDLPAGTELISFYGITYWFKTWFRAVACPALLRAIQELLLLAPYLAPLFQGQPSF